MNSTNIAEPTMENPGQKERRKGLFGGIGRFFKWFWRNRRIQVFFLLFTLALPVFLLIYGIVIPVKNFKPNPVSTNQPLPANEGGGGSVSLTDAQEAAVRTIIQKENQKAFEQSRLALAGIDTIYAVLDIPAKSLNLEIKGVTVKKASITEIEISNKFGLISHENLLPWISEPFTLEKDLATIPQSTMIVKQAPKDTIEAQKQSAKPEPPDSTNIYYTLYFDRNLVIEVEQSNPFEKWETEKVITYKNIKRQESTRSVFKLLKNPQQTDQPMVIRLKLNDSDAKSIYRAVPIKSKLILKL
jgi:hypothetical protein